MATNQDQGKTSMAPTVPVSALDRKRPDDHATAAAVAANQRATTLDAVKSPGELTVFVSRHRFRDACGGFHVVLISHPLPDGVD